MQDSSQHQTEGATADQQNSGSTEAEASKVAATDNPDTAGTETAGENDKNEDGDKSDSQQA